jgi:hypothetical protein
MCGAIPPLSQYTYVAWCSVEAQERLYLYLLRILATENFAKVVFCYSRFSSGWFSFTLITHDLFIIKLKGEWLEMLLEQKVILTRCAGGAEFNSACVGNQRGVSLRGGDHTWAVISHTPATSWNCVSCITKISPSVAEQLQSLKTSTPFNCHGLFRFRIHSEKYNLWTFVRTPWTPLNQILYTAKHQWNEAVFLNQCHFV